MIRSGNARESQIRTRNEGMKWKEKPTDRVAGFGRSYERKKYQKDEDESTVRGNRPPKNYGGKEKSSEAQLDKAELTNRWEREKEKRLEKQKIEKDREMRGVNAKHTMRKKRQNNIDWTREYENDSFEDDDAYYNY